VKVRWRADGEWRRLYREGMTARRRRGGVREKAGQMEAGVKMSLAARAPPSPLSKVLKYIFEYVWKGFA
jgi:hypothetical protein